MGIVNRRAFLLGAPAVAAAAALPMPALALPEPAPLFVGALGQYEGIIIRERALSKRTAEMLIEQARLRRVVPKIVDGEEYFEVFPLKPWAASVWAS